MDRDGFAWISLQFEDRVGFRFVWVDFIGQLDLRLKTIRVDLHRFYRKFIFVVDLGTFYTNSTIWQIEVDSDRFGNI